MSLHPLRSIRRSPGHSVTVVWMLAVGAAVLSLTFTLLDSALFRPPPFPSPERLVLLYNVQSRPRQPDTRLRWSFPRIELLRRLSPEVGTIANYSPSLVTLTHAGEPEAVNGEVTSTEYFRLLGAAPVLGRTFLPEEDDGAAPQPVVILGHGLWRRRFGSDSGIVGRTVRINRMSLTVVGVLGPGFRGLSGTAELWIPAAMAPQLTYPGYLVSDQHFISVVGRLAPGLTVAEADRRFRVIGERIAEALPDPDADSTETLRTTAVPLNQARVSSGTRRSLLLLFSGAALLHLLATANVINLMLGRAVARRREAAILLAVGASAWQRLRHFALEGAILAGAGCLIGVAIAWLVAPLVQLPPDLWGPRSLYGSLSPFAETAFGFRSAGFGAALALGTVLMVSWAPVAGLLWPDVASDLRGVGGRDRSPAGRAGFSLRGAIVAGEVALATVLLLAGGLLLDSFRRMRNTDIGVNAEGVLTFWIRPPEARVPPEQAPEFIERVLAGIAEVPGVEAVTVDGGAPVSGSARSTLIIADRPPVAPADAPPVLRHYVAPDHFRVLGIPLLRGRVFDAGDVVGRPRVAIISQSAATRFWPGEDPIGKRIWFGGGSSFNSPETSAEIVGIVGDVIHEPLDVGHNRADFYTPYRQFTYASRVVMVRTAGDPLALVGGIRRAVNRVDPDLPLVELETLKQRIGGSWARQRFDAGVFGGFAAVALVLAAAGIYAVVAFAVGRRTREMGIRMALGAQPAAVLRLMIGEGMVAPLVGLLLGGAGSLAVTRLLRGVLYQVSPGDPTVLLITMAVLLAVAGLACYFPARRATGVDPTITLRTE